MNFIITLKIRILQLYKYVETYRYHLIHSRIILCLILIYFKYIKLFWYVSIFNLCIVKQGYLTNGDLVVEPFVVYVVEHLQPIRRNIHWIILTFKKDLICFVSFGCVLSIIGSCCFSDKNSIFDGYNHFSLSHVRPYIVLLLSKRMFMLTNVW